MLQDIIGVWESTPTDEIAFGARGINRYLAFAQATQFWNNLASNPLGNLYRQMTLEPYTSARMRKRCNWAWYMLRAVCDTGCGMNLRRDKMDAIDITACTCESMQIYA